MGPRAQKGRRNDTAKVRERQVDSSALVAGFLLAYTQSMTGDTRSLVEQARELLVVGMWGINSGAQNRDRLGPGDQIVAYAGGRSADRAFVGHAVLATAVRPWTPEERQRYPGATRGGDSLPTSLA